MFWFSNHCLFIYILWILRISLFISRLTLKKLSKLRRRILSAILKDHVSLHNIDIKHNFALKTRHAEYIIFLSAFFNIKQIFEAQIQSILNKKNKYYTTLRRVSRVATNSKSFYDVTWNLSSSVKSHEAFSMHMINIIALNQNCDKWHEVMHNKIIYFYK